MNDVGSAVTAGDTHLIFSGETNPEHNRLISIDDIVKVSDHTYGNLVTSENEFIINGKPYDFAAGYERRDKNHSGFYNIPITTSPSSAPEDIFNSALRRYFKDRRPKKRYVVHPAGTDDYVLVDIKEKSGILTLSTTPFMIITYEELFKRMICNADAFLEKIDLILSVLNNKF